MFVYVVDIWDTDCDITWAVSNNYEYILDTITSNADGSMPLTVMDLFNFIYELLCNIYVMILLGIH